MSEEDKLDSWSDKLEASGNSREHALQDVQREIREVVDEAFKEHRGTREDKTDSLSERTLQDAQRDIQERRVKLGKTRKMYQDAQLAYETVQAASSKDPNNKVLSKELEHAKKLRNKYKELMELSQNLLAMKEANHFKLQVAARAVSKRTRLENLNAFFRDTTQRFEADETGLLQVLEIPTGVALPFGGIPSLKTPYLFYRTSHAALIEQVMERYSEHLGTPKSRDSPPPSSTPAKDKVEQVADVGTEADPHKDGMSTSAANDALASAKTPSLESKTDSDHSIHHIKKPIVTYVKPDDLKVLLMGPPGQGKSVFLNVIALHMIQRGYTCVCHSGNPVNPVLVFSNGNVEAWPSEDVLKIPELVDRNTVYLFDPHPGFSTWVLCVPAFTVVATAPVKSNYAMIENEVTIPLYCFPWTKAELKAALPYFGVTNNVWEARQEALEKTGFTLRLVRRMPETFSRYVHEFTQELAGARVDTITKALWATRMKSENFLSEMIVTFARPKGLQETDFTKYQLVPVSEHVRKVCEEAFKTAKHQFDPMSDAFFSNPALYNFLHARP